MGRTILAALLALALAAGGFALYRAVTRLEARVAEVDARADKTIAEKEADIARLASENAFYKEQDVLAEAEKGRLRADLVVKTAENAKLRNDLKTAPPEAVMAQTRDWLDTTEIWLRANAASQAEAVFSLAAFRLNADALAERQHLKFTLVPNLEAQLGESEKQNGAKATTIQNDLIIIAHKDVIIGEKDSQIVVRNDAILALKHRNFWRTVGFIAGSFALGYASHR